MRGSLQVSNAIYMPKSNGAVCNCYSKHSDVSRDDHEFQMQGFSFISANECSHIPTR